MLKQQVLMVNVHKRKDLLITQYTNRLHAAVIIKSWVRLITVSMYLLMVLYQINTKNYVSADEITSE